MSNGEVLVNAWVRIEDACAIDYSVCDDEVEFVFGGRGRRFELLATKDGLEKLMGKGAEALREMRSHGG